MTARHLRTRLSSLFRRDRLETELDVELQYHIDMLIEQNIAGGMQPEEARRAAPHDVRRRSGHQGRCPRYVALPFRRDGIAGHPLRPAEPTP